MMRLDTTRLNAEKYRRSHCERLGMEHQCVGKVTLAPGVMMLDCQVCGQCAEELRLEMGLLDACARIAAVMNVDWKNLDAATQKLVLIEINALRYRHGRQE